jgi:hypothetical protein
MYKPFKITKRRLKNVNGKEKIAAERRRSKDKCFVYTILPINLKPTDPVPNLEMGTNLML